MPGLARYLVPTHNTPSEHGHCQMVCSLQTASSSAGYAKAMQAILSSCGIHIVTATSYNTKASTGHAWNYVYMNGALVRFPAAQQDILHD